MKPPLKSWKLQGKTQESLQKLKDGKPKRSARKLKSTKQNKGETKEKLKN